MVGRNRANHSDKILSKEKDIPCITRSQFNIYLYMNLLFRMFIPLKLVVCIQPPYKNT